MPLFLAFQLQLADFAEEQLQGHRRICWPRKVRRRKASKRPRAAPARSCNRLCGSCPLCRLNWKLPTVTNRIIHCHMVSFFMAFLSNYM